MNLPRAAFAMLTLSLALAACASEPERASDDAEGGELSETKDIVAPTDFTSLTLGGAVQGPLGPEVEASLVSGDVALGNISSSVYCPSGMAACDPENAAEGTIYTYVYRIRPGFDGPNDEGFAMPERVVPVERAQNFALGFPAHGFTGVAGFDVAEARNALADGFNVVISCSDGILSWSLPAEAGWSTGETITFFWQTTQPPVGPEGEYRFAGDGREATGRGPMPAEGGEMAQVCG
ncbi:MAG: hypothetical protein ABR601_04595 [Parasphingopyxis sp.]|nr:hypothetical protein [Sphingomonadales bacterium]